MVERNEPKQNPTGGIWTKELANAAELAWITAGEAIPGLLCVDEFGQSQLARMPTDDERRTLSAAVSAVVPPGRYFRQTRGGGSQEWTPGTDAQDGDGYPFH